MFTETRIKTRISCQPELISNDGIQRHRLGDRPCLGQPNPEAIEHLYQSPVTTIKQVQDFLNLNYVPDSQLVKSLVDLNILLEITGYSRNRIFMFSSYIDTFKE